MATDWVGSSMTIPPISEPYQQTAGAFANILKAMSGSEESDPAKVAKVEGELAGRQDAPLRIVLGAHAYRTVQETAQALAATGEKWPHGGPSPSSSPSTPAGQPGGKGAGTPRLIDIPQLCVARDVLRARPRGTRSRTHRHGREVDHRPCRVARGFSHTGVARPEAL